MHESNKKTWNKDTTESLVGIGLQHSTLLTLQTVSLPKIEKITEVYTIERGVTAKQIQVR